MAHFNKHSLDGATITAEQFAKILLSHTNYDKDSVNLRLQREPPLCAKVINIILKCESQYSNVVVWFFLK